MPNSIRVRNTDVVVGDVLKAGPLAEGSGLCPEGLIVEVRTMTETSSSEIHVGIYSKTSVNGWNNLGGMVSSKHGYWITKAQLEKCFTLLRTIYEVNQPTIFKGLNLQKKKCRVLFEIKSAKEKPVMVEFVDPINGCGGDGLGKSGHCLALPKETLTLIENKSTRF